MLIAEDGLTNQKLICGILQRWGHNLTCVTDGGQAVQEWEKGGYDLILMDVQMPDVDGLQATRMIRELERATSGHIPILAVTAHSLSGDEQKCLDAGMDGYVSKPVRQDALRIALETLFAHAAAQGSQLVDSQAPVDFQSALDAVGGDAGLLRDVIEAMVEELPRLVQDLGGALDRREAPVVQRIAHTIKGSTRVVAPTPAHDIAADIERQARESHLDLAAARLPDMQTAAQNLLDKLNKYLGGEAG